MQVEENNTNITRVTKRTTHKNQEVWISSCLFVIEAF